MKKIFTIAGLVATSLMAASQRDYTALVNPFIGTGGHGHTYPGASMPFGMMQLSPDTRMADWDGSSGYHYSDSVIYGFSHTHLSGTGIPDYCDVLLMPFRGPVAWNKEAYRSRFSHSRETASPGYYGVTLDKFGIRAELTTSYRSGIHQYTFSPRTNDGAVLIDLEHRDQVLEAYLEKVSPYELRGLRRSKSWAPNQSVYFSIVFDQPITEFAVRTEDGSVSNSSLVQGPRAKAFVRFDTRQQKTVKVKIGISGVSTDGAKRNLTAELPDWSFTDLRKAARAAWNTELSRIDIKGGTKDQQTAFYTALYHCSLAPNIYMDVDGQFRSTDGKVHKSTTFTNYSVFSLWDTYRAYHPLMTLINTQRTTDWIQTFLAQYRNGGMLPVWELSGNETFCMIGYHSVPVIVDAYQKGIRGFDTVEALAAMRSYAESNRFGLDAYRQNGFLSNEKEHESVSKTLEYAYDDWCIAQYAGWMGQDSIARVYRQRAQSYKNLFDPTVKHMRGRVHGMWFSPFDPAEVNNFFTEGNSWHYSFAVPQDLKHLMELYGGREGFTRKLDQLFSVSSTLTGRQQADVTGLIGQYAQGNEPSHHMAYLYNYAGAPWRTQELIHRICTEFYRNNPDGLIGNEDCGQMSAWLVMSALGFYPVTPGTGDYVMGTPLFEEATVKLENGKKLTIRANRKTPGAFYINSASLNARPLNRSYLAHADLIRGGNLVFNLQATPNKVWGTTDLPITSIDRDLIVAVPQIKGSTNKFRDSLRVELATTPGTTLWYRWIQPNIRSQFVQYHQPIWITQSGELEAYAEKGGVQSKTVVQPFYKYPDRKTIVVTSKVHPMYTAGGPEALIDGVQGTTNWKTGEWQSYFDTDFEAVVDLQEIKAVSYVGVHVLQDISPWILYPKEVIYSASTDGKTYTEIGRVKNGVDQKMETVQTQELGVQVQLKTRYLKVRAVSGGTLPAWHESAGNPSHLFIDEVIVR